MFYKQFLKITDLNADFVENFDYWLATLPTNNRKNITASVVSARLNVSYKLADTILKFATQEKILEKYYVVKCPDCDMILSTFSDPNDEVLTQGTYCDDCEEQKQISFDDIYVAYKLIMKANASEKEIAKAIEKRLNLNSSSKTNFQKADSLSDNKNELDIFFYNPSESAYNKFKDLRNKLDLDYSNTTEKGRALERLVLAIFSEIKGVLGTNYVRTQTHQFDCTLISDYKKTYPSVLDYLSPYFIIECKNEDDKPSNNYMDKLGSIIGTNEATLGIVFGRKDATKTCFIIAREYYLSTMNTNKKRIIFTCSDDDLNYIIDKKVNLLTYISFKIFQITSNSPTSTFEKFSEKSN